MEVMLDGKNNNLSLRWELNLVYSYANSAKRNYIVFPSNMAAVSLGYKPRIAVNLLNLAIITH